MELLKTVKKNITGSDKLFDIYKCTVDEVDTFESASGKQMIAARTEGQTFKGLYNKWVYDYLCENEGEESFIVLWRAPKGDSMLAYVRSIWEEHLQNIYNVEVPFTDKAYETQSTDAFVYMWVNTVTDKKYIGKHKGTIADGYICSSQDMLAEYAANPSHFLRTVLAYGSDQEMLELETILLLQLRTSQSPFYYNMSNNLRLN